MKQYKDLLARVKEQGSLQNNRTGIPAVSKAGDMMVFDLQEGFPVVTLRKSAWKSAIGEMIAFMNGYTNAAQFRELKCNFWTANANSHGTDISGNTVLNPWLSNPARKGEDDLGEVYGYQWSNWEADNDGITVSFIDQFENAIKDIMTNPTSRRIIVSAWRPDKFNQMALPPCHVLYQFLVNVEKQELSLNMYIRSNDLFLGTPANIVEYAFLLQVMALATDLKPKWFNYFIGDAHIYQNHLEQVDTMLSREVRPMPTLVYKKDPPACIDYIQAKSWLLSLHPDDFHLDGYEPHEPLTGVMAV